MNVTDHGPVTISVGEIEIEYDGNEKKDLFSVDEIPHRCKVDVTSAGDGKGTKLLFSTRMTKLGELHRRGGSGVAASREHCDDLLGAVEDKEEERRSPTLVSLCDAKWCDVIRPWAALPRSALLSCPLSTYSQCSNLAFTPETKVVMTPDPYEAGKEFMQAMKKAHEEGRDVREEIVDGGVKKDCEEFAGELRPMGPHIKDIRGLHTFRKKRETKKRYRVRSVREEEGKAATAGDGGGGGERTYNTGSKAPSFTRRRTKSGKVWSDNHLSAEALISGTQVTTTARSLGIKILDGPDK